MDHTDSPAASASTGGHKPQWEGFSLDGRTSALMGGIGQKTAITGLWSFICCMDRYDFARSLHGRLTCLQPLLASSRQSPALLYNQWPLLGSHRPYLRGNGLYTGEAHWILVPCYGLSRAEVITLMESPAKIRQYSTVHINLLTVNMHP
jgi:hypothetical protein